MPLKLTRAAILAALLSAPAFADAPLTSLRPVLRPLAPAETTLNAKAAALSAQSPVWLSRPLARAVGTAGGEAQPMSLAVVEPLLAPAPVLSAQSPVRSPRPPPRPLGTGGGAAQPVSLAAVESPPGQTHPRPRPGTGEDQVVLAALRVPAPLSVPRPQPRPTRTEMDETGPERIETVAAVRILPGKSAIFGRKGSVCGDRAIKGEVLPPITSRVLGCGIEDPVRITSVDGVALNPSAVVACDTARALKDWVSTGLKPAFGRKDVVSFRVAASYACRTRNNIKGAKISEHGRGKAIDIGSIQLANGTSVSVAEDWRRSAGKPMKKAYRKACGIFGTTLGPDADRYHRDHMHFDVARQYGGPYCR